MKLEPEHFSIQLTRGELFFAASALGFLRLPLPEDPYRGWLIEDIQADILKGRESLQARGLIRRKSAAEWEMDDYLLVFVRWVASPEYTLSVNAWRTRSQGPWIIAIHYQRGASLVVERAADIYQLTLFQEEYALDNYLLERMEIISQEIASNAQVIKISKKKLENLIAVSTPSVPLAMSDFCMAIGISEPLSFLSHLSLHSWQGVRNSVMSTR